MVFISEVGSNVKVAVPVDKDNFISLQIFNRYFPGAAGLVYFEKGAETPISFDESNTKLVPPAGGWNDSVFYVVRSQISRPHSPMIVDYEMHRLPAPLSKSIERWMFYVMDNAGKSCVVCVHRRYFVTFRHGTHLQFVVGQTIIIYQAISEEQFSTTVCYINEDIDFVLLKSEQDVVEKGPALAVPEPSESFILAGFGNAKQNLTFLPAIVSDTQDWYFSKEGGSVSGPFILGTGLSAPGDSGAGCWSSRGLIGISLGCTRMPTTPHHSAIADAAIFSPKNYIASSLFIKYALKMEQMEQVKEQVKTGSPSTKKPCHVIDMDGVYAESLTSGE